MNNTPQKNVWNGREKINLNEFNLLKDDTRNDIYYVLAMIPYPSWAGMHLWHVINYTSVDVIWKFKKLNGYKVLNPICWDSFWLPTENYAMKLWKSASEVTTENISNFKNQALTMNRWYDWNREFATSSPEYYKWTQWIFAQLFKKWLAYKEKSYVNWCPTCNTALANDQIINGKCERDETEVVQKQMPQWFIKITDYADRLIDDLEDLDWPEETKRAQINWIGRKKWIIVKFDIDSEDKLEIFTEDPLHIENASAIRICPEHQILDKLVGPEDINKLEEYRKYVIKKTNLEREHLSHNAKWLELWISVINPLNGKKIPLIIDEKILPTYGTWTEFIVQFSWEETNYDEAREQIKQKIITNWYGEEKVIYKLRDRSISRQRYWWSPIPIYYDENWQPQLIDENELPVLLPLDVDNYKPMGKSPLENHPSFSEYKKWEKVYKRECDTLDTFVDSSFYFLRFLDPKNQEEFLSKDISNKISDVDFYMWWKEHNVWHLLYARFIHKFLYDLGIVDTKEPFKKLFHQWMILASDGRKMSKRWWNVVDPMDLVKRYSPDILKMGVLFLWPIEETKSWDDAPLKGIDNFLRKFYSISKNVVVKENGASKEELDLINTFIGPLTQDIQNFKFNTAISKFMVLSKNLSNLESIDKEIFNKILIMLSIFAPDTAENIWKNIWNDWLVGDQEWPNADETKIEKKKIKLPIQVNWKFKNIIEIDAWSWLSENDILNLLKENWLYDKIIWNTDIKKIIFKEDKVLNFVV